MKIINLTPHAINFVDGGVIPSSVPGTTTEERIANAPKVVAKDPTSTEEYRLLEDGTTMVHVWHDPNPTEIVGLPEPQEDIILVVLMPVATAAAALGRTDVYSPATSKPGAGATKDGMMKVPGLVNFH